VLKERKDIPSPCANRLPIRPYPWSYILCIIMPSLSKLFPTSSLPPPPPHPICPCPCPWPPPPPLFSRSISCCLPSARFCASSNCSFIFLISSSCFVSRIFCLCCSRLSATRSHKPIEAVKVPTSVDARVATMKVFCKVSRVRCGRRMGRVGGYADLELLLLDP
jgi:hypothetical protein